MTGFALHVPAPAHVATEAPVAEAVHRREVPVGVDAPAATRPAVDTVAKAAVVPGTVEVAVVADRNPAGVTAGPVPIDPGRGVESAGAPGPAVARQAAPAAVVIGNPAPGLIGDPGVAGGRPGPPALPVGAPAVGDVGPPVGDAVDLDPVAGVVERRRVIGEMGFDVPRAARGALGPVGQHSTPALEVVGFVGRAELEVRLTAPQGDDRFVGTHHGGAAVGDHLGVPATGDDPCPGFTVAPDAGLDPILAGLLHVDGGVRGDDARELVAERFVGDCEEELAAFEPQDGDALLAVAREGDALEDDAGRAAEEEAIAIRKRQLESRARLDANQIAGEEGLVGLERLADSLPGSGDGRRPLQGTQIRIARALVGDRCGGLGRLQRGFARLAESQNGDEQQHETRCCPAKSGRTRSNQRSFGHLSSPCCPAQEVHSKVRARHSPQERLGFLALLARRHRGGQAAPGAGRLQGTEC